MQAAGQAGAQRRRGLARDLRGRGSQTWKTPCEPGGRRSTRRRGGRDV